jgi:predicted RNase H-like HicB family nuclease
LGNSGHRTVILETKEAKVKYKVGLEPQEEGSYTVFVPTLPGCVLQGETTEEALANIKEGIEVYLESLKERGIPLPQIEEREVAV